MSISTRKAKKYLLVLGCFSSLIGIIFMIIGYSKVDIKLEVTDIFNPETGVNYSLDYIMRRITENFSRQESHYFIVVSGLSMGLCFSSILATILIDIFSDASEKDKFMFQNPMSRVEVV
jgi:hypothetical protein